MSLETWVSLAAIAGFAVVVIGAVRRPLNDFREEVRAEFVAVRAELKSEISGCRAETAGLRTELKAEIADVRTEIASLRTELTSDIASLDDRVSRLDDRVYGLAVGLRPLFDEAATRSSTPPA